MSPFQTWKIFHFDGNFEILDSYVTRIRRCATLLVYGKPQILEMFQRPYPEDHSEKYFLSRTD